MGGVYVHIPFCRKACHYCNFHFSTSLKLKNDFIYALLKEIEITATKYKSENENDKEAKFLNDENIETIYFGGGTPSLLSGEELKLILEKIRNYYNISPSAELTLEANPDDINIMQLKEWKQAGINRLSIGVQSFFDEDLQWMNRAHTSSQAFSAIEASQLEGFNNITVDLIYGTPTLSDEKWKENVALAVKLKVPHLSCYALTVEPSTALHALIVQKKLENIDEGKQARQFLLLIDWLEKEGYDHYEISNFAKPGMRSRHNSAYWQGKNYIGFGPSAHSFDGKVRQWNISNNSQYIESLKNNILPLEKEQLTDQQQLNEYIMTSLRTIEGIDLTYVEKKFGSLPAIHVERSLMKYLESGKIKLEEKKVRLTNEGKLYADGIAADLFI